MLRSSLSTDSTPPWDSILLRQLQHRRTSSHWTSESVVLTLIYDLPVCILLVRFFTLELLSGMKTCTALSAVQLLLSKVEESDDVLLRSSCDVSSRSSCELSADMLIELSADEFFEMSADFFLKCPLMCFVNC